MLEIENLRVNTAGKEIIRGIALKTKKGGLHAVMGPNGSGKSTLAASIAGHPAYEVTQGSIKLDGKDLLGMEPEERAAAGLFLGFQYPIELAGVPAAVFLREALNARGRALGEKPRDPMEAVSYIRKMAKEFGLNEEMLKRQVNVGFSGGEKKRFEIFQLYLLKARVAVLDETDSGLDIDALKEVAESINRLRDGERSFLLITHYRRLLDYVKPDAVHVMYDDEIVAEGGAELATRLEAEGYAGFQKGGRRR